MMTQWNKLAAGLVLGAFSILPLASPAATLHNDWYYAIDSLNDGSGGSSYEVRGLAYRILGDKAYFAISSGMPLGGVASGASRNGAQSYGDLFLNFSSHNLDTAGEFTDANVFGVRFDSSNDSFGNMGGTNTTLGLFKTITPAALANVNNGYSTLKGYIDAGFGRTTDAMGDLEDSQSSGGDVRAYLGYDIAMQTNIHAGTKIGDITLLNKTQLATQGLDYSFFTGADPSGNNVFGFSFDRQLLPVGNFTAHFFLECINDGTAITGETPQTPEPSTFAFLGAGVLGALTVVRRRRK